MHPPVVELRGLSKTFLPKWAFTEKHALSDITLSIPPGTVLGLVGANGSGKTPATYRMAQPRTRLTIEPQRAGARARSRSGGWVWA